jgi:hypothetical protein
MISGRVLSRLISQIPVFRHRPLGPVCHLMILLSMRRPDPLPSITIRLCGEPSWFVWWLPVILSCLPGCTLLLLLHYFEVVRALVSSELEGVLIRSYSAVRWGNVWLERFRAVVQSNGEGCEIERGGLTVWFCQSRTNSEFNVDTSGLSAPLPLPTALATIRSRKGTEDIGT